MLRLGQSVAMLFASGACFVFVTTAAHAQLSGRHAGTGGFSTTDEAALGDTLLASVGLFDGNEYTVGGGMGVAGGALRGYFGGLAETRGAYWTLGAGYARSIATRAVAGSLRAVIGGELLAAVRHAPLAPHEFGALTLTAPVGLSFGDPSGPSLGLYAMPYAEEGLARQWVLAPCATGGVCQTLGDVGQTRALGVGAEMRMSFGRFSVGIMLGDVLGTGRHIIQPSDAVIGLTYRLGR